MIQVRTGVFETNSSSVHALCICTEEEYEKYKNGELFFNPDYKKIVTKHVGAEEITDPPDGYGLSFEEMKCHWFSTDLDYMHKERILPGGETVVAFGWCGHD